MLAGGAVEQLLLAAAVHSDSARAVASIAGTLAAIAADASCCDGPALGRDVVESVVAGLVKHKGTAEAVLRGCHFLQRLSECSAKRTILVEAGAVDVMVAVLASGSDGAAPAASAAPAAPVAAVQARQLAARALRNLSEAEACKPLLQRDACLDAMVAALVNHSADRYIVGGVCGALSNTPSCPALRKHARCLAQLTVAALRTHAASGDACASASLLLRHLAPMELTPAVGDEAASAADASEASAVRSVLVRIGAVPALCTALREHNSLGESFWAARICAGLVQIALDEHGRKQLVRSGAVPLVVALLRNGMDDLALVQQACGLFQPASVVPDCVGEMAAANALPLLIRALEAHGSDRVVAVAACSALHNAMVVCSEVKPLAAHAGTVQAAVSLLTEYAGSDADVANVACRTIWQLSSYKPPHARSLLLRSGADEAALAALRAHSDSADVAAAACGVLCDLATGSAAVQHRFACLGVPAAVIDALKLHDGHARVAWAACSAVSAFAAGHAGNTAALIGAGAVQAMMAAIATHSASSSVTAAACRALLALVGKAAEAVALLAASDCSLAVAADSIAGGSSAGSGAGAGAGSKPLVGDAVDASAAPASVIRSALRWHAAQVRILSGSPCGVLRRAAHISADAAALLSELLMLVPSID